MDPLELARGYKNFFLQSAAGKEFLIYVQSQEADHIAKAQKQSSLSELDRSYMGKEIQDHISSVIAQVAGRTEE